MQDWLRIGVPVVGLSVLVWQFAGHARKYGGWTAIRETGGYWLLLLIVVSFAGGTYLSTDLPRGDMSKATRALLALGSMTSAVAGLVGLLWRLSSGQLQRFSAKYARLREDGHLADDPAVPLRATSVEELERLEARIWEVRVALKGVPRDRALSLGNAPDLIERDLRRIDDALHEARVLSSPARQQLAR